VSLAVCISTCNRYTRADQSLEVALNFKNHGNEHHLAKQYKDAVKAYTEGLDAGPTDFELRISLLNNRAACNLALRNYGLVLKDVGVIIALSTKDGKVVPIKALYRAAKSLIALERWKEATDVVTRGKEAAEDKAKREVLEGDIARGVRRGMERAERLRREMMSKESLRLAVQVGSFSHVKPEGE
jgi:tetratricopeptide (TPR) repeat protein